MSLVQTLHFSKDANASEIMAHPDSFRLRYFQIFTLGQTCRDMLAFAGAKWEDTYPSDWMAEKTTTPFECLPILYIRKDNKELMISECTPIEHYLARQLGFLGKNQYEETLIMSFHSSSSSLLSTFGNFVVWNQPEVRDKCYNYFKQSLLTRWITNHEMHLVDNGSNGHYITLADIKTANVIEIFICQPDGNELAIQFQNSPALWKVYETVTKHPLLADWRSCESFKKLEQNTKLCYKDPRAYVRRPRVVAN
ncbi:hypothetical protein BGW38_001470 [Lunasporangiospora selenospora]|uniref:GST N-terminal domain-containing protein n=1 Tax=Lunasporangiospora selenospora TaxID=979761 RepID=A0A9P6KE88_9FUNG|nr:hypothetical protein BGW38_001470 [Lunasporangiospora selenospora]